MLRFDFSAPAVLATNVGWMMSASTGFAPPWQLAADPALPAADARRALMSGAGVVRTDRAAWWAIASTVADVPALDPRWRSLASNKVPVLVADLDTGATVVFLVRAGLSAGRVVDGPATLEVPLAASLDDLVPALRAAPA